MKKQVLPLVCLLLALLLLMAAFYSCRKNKKEPTVQLPENVERSTQTQNGITNRVYVKKDIDNYKGILVMGSGNDENNPSQGGLDGDGENTICQKAAVAGYVAAIVQYRKGPGTPDWNRSAEMMGEDYNNCITALAAQYGVDKSKSVVGGYSYASFMLYTTIAYYDHLNYCKGLLAACGSTDQDKINKFKIPVFAINCSGFNEGDNVTAFLGKELYDQIPNSSPIKAKSGGITDQTCNTHCGKTWTEEMFNRLKSWLP